MNLEHARDLIKSAHNIVVLTGAGLSTDSGIPDFRGPQGVWTKDPDAEKLSNIHYYLSDTNIRKKAWQSRLQAFNYQAKPNSGHRALLKLEQQGKLLMLITQNIDGLHEMAGHSADKIIEIHGTMQKVQCMDCDYRVGMDVIAKRLNQGETDPECPNCCGILKSATISFGQNLVAEDLQRAEQAALACDLCLAVGTTLGVYPAAGIVPLAKQTGAKVIIINGEPTELDNLADVVLQGRIGEILPPLLK